MLIAQNLGFRYFLKMFQPDCGIFWVDLDGLHCEFVQLRVPVTPLLRCNLQLLVRTPVCVQPPLVKA